VVAAKRLRGRPARRRRGVALRAIPLFEDLDEALLSVLAKRFVAERHAEGRVIFEEAIRGTSCTSSTVGRWRW
jgi:hypothetical protein